MANNKKKNVWILVITSSLIFVIGTIAFIILYNNNTYNEAKNLFDSGSYYDVFSIYYKKLNGSNKAKIKKLLVEEISHKKWKSQYEMTYTNFNNCVGNEYVEVDNEIANHYIICGNEQYEYGGANGKSKINLELQQIDNSKIVFKMTGSDNLYLFIYRNDEINIETGSVNSSRNYQMFYHKFDVEK